MNDKPKSGTERREPTRMELIPGAAYLSPSEKRVYIALEDGWARYDVGSASPGAVPADLILLYAQGDKVYDHTAKGRRFEDHDVCITRSTDV